MKRAILSMAVAGSFIASASGQGFMNLNFESAYDLPKNPPEVGVPVSATNALPDWTTPYFNVYYVSNSTTGGYATDVELEGGSLALSGDFSVGLFQNGSISQTGMVPDNAESLDFEAYVPGQIGLGASGLTVSLGGQNLPILSEGGDVYGVDIPADLDGLTEILAFSCQGVGSGNLLLDNIEFSPTSVPEPGEWGLIGVGAMVFAFWRRKGRV